MVYVPLNSNFEVDMKAYRNAINRNTILLVGSAPQYPHGIVDPIEEICSIALQKGLPVHVDACVGGLMLPWAKKAGYPIPNFDFQVAGVTSISADIHKYGFSQKGSSVILYKNESYRKHQIFSYSEWPGGLYATCTISGSRNGGPVAVGWTALCYQGQEGYLRFATELMETAKYIKKEIAEIPELYIIGKPSMTLLSFASNKFNIYVIGDLMERDYGWKLERQQLPASIHLTLSPPHIKAKEKLIQDLKATIEKLKQNPSLTTDGSAAVYKMVESIPSRPIIEDYLTTFFGKMFSQH